MSCVCTYNASISLAIGEKIHVGCEQTCICNANGKIDCKERCQYKSGAVRDGSCKEVPDENDPLCCVVYSCKHDDMSTTAPKVLVTQRSPTSLTIAWDDFKLPNYQSGYIVEYRPVVNYSSDEWIRIQANNTPFMTINELKPHSAYQIRVQVWDDVEAKKMLSGSGSEMITAFTEDGCYRNNKTYSVGQEFFEGCDLRCICRGADEGECSDRCPQPFFRAGTMKHDADCIEEPATEGDSCCAKCRNKPMQKVSQFSDKAGKCPKNVEENENDDSKMCAKECQHDHHCTGAKKCCRTNCGGTACLQPLATNVGNLCDLVRCGPNAFCEIQTGKCKCLANYTGDANDHKFGCRPDENNRKNLVCVYKNNTYNRGQEFFDGCEHKCICSEALEVECSPRCPFIVPKGGQLLVKEPLCTIIQDPKDSCCKTIACETKSSEPTTDVEKSNGTFNEESNTFADAISVEKPLIGAGCHHNGITYKTNESFTEGCESRCKCKPGAKLECKPRCPTFVGDSDKKFCQLMPDPDDPECCKIAVCDVREGARKDNPSIILDSAEPFNSSSAILRVILPKENVSNETQLELNYAKVDSEMTVENEKLKLNWIIKIINKDTIKSAANNGHEIRVDDLSPATEYFIKVVNLKDNSSSNTVVVRTYPKGIDSSFNGCFHGNKTYEVGEQFFDGCEYKCICREGGLRECEERCPVYIDTVGYENCEWGLAPDDNCCTVPICDKVPKLPKKPLIEPESEHFCAAKNGKIYTLDQTWEEGEGCLKKRCKCVQLSNGTVSENCKGGCATIPPSALKPTLECQKPEMVIPDDPCLCPYVVCNHNTNPINLPPTLPGSGRPNLPIVPPKSPKDHLFNKKMCEFKGRKIAIGEEFHDGCRAVCHCGTDTRVNCALIECPHHFGTHVSECLEWDIDPNFVPTPPECCPPPKCKNDGSCSFAGLRFPNFKQVPQNLLPCGTSCVCVNGNVTCENHCPSLTDIPPPNLPCPPSLAYRGYLPGDTCCMHWLCRGQERGAFCLHNGHRYKLGEQWDDPSPINGLSSKRRCQCKPSMNGLKPNVQCFPGQCPQITERHLRPTPECPIPVIVTPDDPVMCPYVVCNYSDEAVNNGKELENVSIVTLNSTTVRVRFTLPPLLVGLVGHAELHYTTDPLLPGNQWQVQKFARPKRLFDTPNIEYHLGNLQPDTDYFFQIRIIIEALQTGPESEVFKLHLPRLPTTTTLTTSTTTTTTTLPPMIMLDAHLNAKPMDASTMKVSWRAFEPQEKRLLDGVQILYKRVDLSDNDWSRTPIIHRDVNNFILRDLTPGASYLIDLYFKPAEYVSSNLKSTKSVTVLLPTKPKDEFDFTVSVDSANDVFVDSSRCIIHLKGVPHPVNKYINVVKISFKNIDSKNEQQITHIFKIPSNDGTIVVDGLQPTKRYKAWIDLFLANGRTITANAFDFTTKEGVKNEHKADDPATNEAEALRESSTTEAEIIRPYYVALTIVALFAIVTGIGFVAMLCVLLKTKSSAKAPITRAPSESAYDNPTYKTYDGERPVDEPIKNGTIPA
ncbi:epidermal cell surface receptor-like protein [Dinothrombium tinctorium]|uniref:Epidermal cell surface receptor-like protein n=1 Tax=Dinothrombium tinctorium TaxID=1965070 RepID=A0A3S3SCT4_9ACAR|nr:epidermal cell surface receptor-like protein [Dinothrombium tinctorium]RWS13601.1 epidermal cell surface receptor-like protein [Dinothrombium tinctorium]